jgi:carbon storage regulator CsrA
MLVLSRKPGEKLHIGNNIVLTVIDIKGNRARIGIDAPDDVRVLRSELYQPWDSSDSDRQTFEVTLPEHPSSR